MKLLTTLATLLLAAAALADDAGFKPLFNGKDTAGWHLRKEGGHNSWSVADSVLKNTVEKGQHGTDLVSDAKFWNFTVKFEYMVPDGSNSGFYLRGRHEVQVFDDYKTGKPGLGGNGAIYNVKAPSLFASRKPGQWQQAEVRIVGQKITVVLNGVKIHDNVDCPKGTGSQLDDNVDQPGPILLQGDHGSVAFRNIRIRQLR